MPTTRSSPAALSDSAVTALVREREKFRRFLVRRTGSEAAAEDLLQESLLRALQRGDSLRSGERVTAWFYRILRRALADHFRRQSAERRRFERYEVERKLEHSDAFTPPADFDTAICRCLAGLLASLPGRYAVLIRRIDLDGEPRPVVAHELGLSAGTLDVALHRARRTLRRRLEVFCGACSRESCLRCACGASSAPAANATLQHGVPQIT